MQRRYFVKSYLSVNISFVKSYISCRWKCVLDHQIINIVETSLPCLVKDSADPWCRLVGIGFPFIVGFIISFKEREFRLELVFSNSSACSSSLVVRVSPLDVAPATSMVEGEPVLSIEGGEENISSSSDFSNRVLYEIATLLLSDLSCLCRLGKTFDNLEVSGLFSNVTQFFPYKMQQQCYLISICLVFDKHQHFNFVYIYSIHLILTNQDYSDIKMHEIKRLTNLVLL